MSEWLNKGSGTVLKYGGRMLMPPIPRLTIRVKFRTLSDNPNNFGYTGTWTAVDASRNIWDYYIGSGSDRYLDYKSTKTLIDGDIIGTNIGTTPQNWEYTFRNQTLIKHAHITLTLATRQMNSTFYGCTGLESVTIDNGEVNTSSAAINPPRLRTLIGTFYGCTSLKAAPLFDTSMVTSMTTAFAGCSNLKSVPLYDLSRATNVKYVFSQCSNLESVPLFNLSAAADISGIFSFCTKLRAIPNFDLTSVENADAAFDYCYYVETGALAAYQQLSSKSITVTSHSDTFRNCGRYTTTGAAELAQIPSSWGGTGA